MAEHAAHSKIPIFPVSLFLLAASVLFFVVTKNYLALLTPIALAFILLVIANWKLAWWLLLFSIPLSIQFGLSNGSLSLSLPDEPICWVCSLVFVLLIANDPRIIPQWWWNNPLLIIIVLQLFWLIVAVAFSTVFMLSVKFLAAKLWYLASFFVFPIFIFKEKRDFRTAFLLLLIPLTATMAVITWRLSTMHYSFAAIGAAVGDLYMNHVEYASVIAIFYPLMWVAYPLTKSKWARISLAGLLLLFIPGIYFSFARVAVVALAFALVVGVAIRLRLAHFVMPVVYSSIIVALIFLVRNNKYIDLHPDYYHTTMHSDYNGHISSTFEGKDVSSMERLYRWVAAIRMSVDRPITGYGPHGFVYNYKPYTVALFKTFVSNNREHTTTHNYFLYMLTEQGWPAMLLYALLNVAVITQAQRTYHRFKDKFWKYITLGLTMAFASSFVVNFFSELIETHKCGALFYLIIALLMILRQKSLQQDASSDLTQPFSPRAAPVFPQE